MGKHILRIFKKIFKKKKEPTATSYNNASWYTDTYGFLEDSDSGGSAYYIGFAFQKNIPFFRGGGSPPIYVNLVL